MQIVIEIPEDIKEDIDKHSRDMACSIVENRSLSIAEAIRNGIKLPLAHGRLIDETELLNVGEPSWDIADILSETKTILEETR